MSLTVEQIMDSHNEVAKMSAAIVYRPIKPKGEKNLGVLFPSGFLEIMQKCFGDPPFTLETKDIPILTGMAAAWTDDDNPFQRIIDKIEQYGGIEVWAEY